MTVTSKQHDRFVVLYGVPWETYEGFLDALDEHYLRHTYIEGTLEMRAVVNCVSWQQYKKFLEALGDYSLRHTYDGWTLEMMSPRKDHDWDKRFVGRIVETICFALDIDVQCIGSTTLASEAIERGLQPDEAYYIANEPLVRGKDTFEPDVDPPPDLILEVDVTSTSVPRMPLFAKLGIPEVWRHDGDRTIFYRLLKKGTYKEIRQSIAFPFLSPGDIDECLDQLHELPENKVLRTLLDAVQNRISNFKKGTKKK